MTSACFTSLPFKLRYTSGADDLLRAFYIPVLKRARHYDRAVGFFSSNALVVAAQGIAHLIAHGGTMRLLIGAQLSPEDAEAIRRGEEERERVLASALARLVPDPETLADHIARQRLEALAWMVASGTLHIRVVLPRQGTQAALFHVKYGVLTDACGHRIAFQGSINETASGWQANYEEFSVFCSWKPGEEARVEDFRQEFQHIWENRHPFWRAYPIPEAVRRRLLEYKPAEPPTHDPLETQAAAPLVREKPEEASIAPGPILARFLRDAPHFPNADRLALVTSAVHPWPHQRFILQHILERYPQRFLIADEVGLGKTISAGLVLRQLWLMGLARRVLILAPRSLLRQWQEELYEKFNLSVPIYDGRTYRFWDGRQEPAPAGPDAWEAKPWLLASAQMARRRERREALLQAAPWDVVVVDEAHHARRRDFLDLKRYRPNQLLTLLQALSYRTEFLLLLTATPMQVHPIEVWDLLSLLGLSGRWMLQDGRAFVAYFQALASSPVDWSQVLPLLRDEWNLAEEPERERDLKALNLRGPQRQRLERLLHSDRGSLEALPRTQRKALEAPLQRLARQYTPLRRLVLRHTRETLRAYRQRGLLQAPIPRRRPFPRWIPMRPEEHALYREVSDYIATFYRRYEETRRGLGFVLTVYRRRLTSSLYALRRSLERRLQALQRAKPSLEPEDELSAESLLLGEDLLDEVALLAQIPDALRQEEIRALERLLDRLSFLGDYDSKSEQLLSDLREIFQRRDRVLVFTQYTDTLDHLRERLVRVYGQAVACYSGRGGELWDGQKWVSATKERVKNAFRSGEVRLLLATDAASEGLNLQTCGVLINYDMPWNPMRVEQRIGRIDRIGQVHDEVWIYHYFYQDTIEEKVYRRLGERIGFFQHVVGPLQPILMRVEDMIQRLAVLPPTEQEAVLQTLLAQLEEEAPTISLNLDEWVEPARSEAEEASPPWTPEALEAWIRDEPDLRGALHPLDSEGRRYRLHLPRGPRGQVTFRPQEFEAHPNTVVLLTYGHPWWEAWLENLAGSLRYVSHNAASPRLLILRSRERPPLTVWYVRTAEGGVQRILTLEQLRDLLPRWSTLLPWEDDAVAVAEADFRRLLQERRSRWKRNRARLAALWRHALLARGRYLWQQCAALLLFQMERHPLFRGPRTPDGLWQTIRSWGEPFDRLGRLLQAEKVDGAFDLAAIREVLLGMELREVRPEALARRRASLKTQIQRWLEEWHRFQVWSTDGTGEPTATPIEKHWL